MIRSLCYFFVLVFAHSVGADGSDTYYAAIKDSKNLKESLYTVLSSYHLPRKGEDLILPQCSESGCYRHTPVSYNTAKKYLFGFLHLSGNSPQTYKLDNYYCVSQLSNSDFKGKQSLAPMHVPDNNVVNTEHTWPQSLFTKKFPKDSQKANLHILFPTRSKVNSLRGSYPFGEVVETKNAPCSTAALGLSKEGERVFEPDDVIKGDIARAVFYYVTRYKVELGQNQETYLRNWHNQDPVDEKEALRNEKIFDIQKDRNPFIDHPEFVDQIANF